MQRSPPHAKLLLVGGGVCLYVICICAMESVVWQARETVTGLLVFVLLGYSSNCTLVVHSAPSQWGILRVQVTPTDIKLDSIIKMSFSVSRMREKIKFGTRRKLAGWHSGQQLE